ncbi:MAG: GIY-YIG nuclease family protein [Candidatus Vogelbacteria bacterium]
MAYNIYVLYSQKDNRTYVGQTGNLERRLSEHNSGKVKSTKFRLPLKLLFTEEFSTSVEAKRRELWWKSSTGRLRLREYFKKTNQLTITDRLIC